MSTTTPTGIGPIDYIIYLIFGLVLLAIAALTFTTVIDPLIAEENTLLAFIVWMLGAVWLAARSL